MLKIAPVEEGVESDGETHTETGRHEGEDTQREKPRQRQRTRCGHSQRRAVSGGAFHLYSTSPGEKTQVMGFSVAPRPLHHHAQPPRCAEDLKQKLRCPPSSLLAETRKEPPVPTAPFSVGVIPPWGIVCDWFLPGGPSIILGHTSHHQPM